MCVCVCVCVYCTSTVPGLSTYIFEIWLSKTEA